jgi:hypothetical protein
VEDNCVKHFLEREVAAFAPKIVFCFGNKVFAAVQSRFSSLNPVRLYHPSFIQNYAHTRKMSRSTAMIENDQRIADAIARLPLGQQK